MSLKSILLKNSTKLWLLSSVPNERPCAGVRLSTQSINQYTDCRIKPIWNRRQTNIKNSTKHKIKTHKTTQRKQTDTISNSIGYIQCAVHNYKSTWIN